MAQLIYPIYWMADVVLDLFKFVIFASVILSWLLAFEVVNIRNPLVRGVADICGRITDPFLKRLRRFIPSIGGLDLTPMVLLFIVFAAQYYLSLAYRSLL